MVNITVHRKFLRVLTAILNVRADFEPNTVQGFSEYFGRDVPDPPNFALIYLILGEIRLKTP
jgi:hypothetical protein